MRVEIAGKLHRIGKSFLAVLEPVLDALAESCGHGGHKLRPEFAADRISPERQRQTSHLLPPLAQIDDAMQA